MSHGRADPLFPIDPTSRTIVQRLKKLLPGREIRYIEFDGGHEVPSSVSEQALQWFLKGTPVKGSSYSQAG